jgi:hypothetical protein
VAVHPFPADDNRARKVLAYPEDCEAPTTKGPAKNRKQRRDGVRAARDASTPLPTIVDFGSDHWSTFGYIEVRIVDHGGHPQREHMRCIDARRPFQAHGHDASDTPTRLKGEATLPNHDDWDCLDDLEREGLLTSLGTAVHPLYALTPRGEKVAAQLRQHKGRGGSFATFTPDVEGAAP